MIGVWERANATLEESNEDEFDPEGFIDTRCRTFAASTYKRLTGRTIRPQDICASWTQDGDEVNCPAYDIYADAWVRGWRAYLRYDAARDGGISREAFIGWHIYHQLPDDFFAAPVFVPKNAGLAFLDARASSIDPAGQRQAWVDSGRSGVDFDQINSLLASANRKPSTTTNDTGLTPSEYELRKDEEATVLPDDFDVEGVLFSEEFLTEVERRVWTFHRAGFSHVEIGGFIPADLLGHVADPGNKVDKIWAGIKAKARDFWGEA